VNEVGNSVDGVEWFERGADRARLRVDAVVERRTLGASRRPGRRLAGLGRLGVAKCYVNKEGK
jgi:hypothetical protein